MIHFKLTFDCMHDGWGEAGVSIDSFACGYPIVLVPFVEKIIPFPYRIILASL